MPRKGNTQNYRKQCLAGHAYNLGTEEQGQAPLHSQFKASLPTSKTCIHIKANKACKSTVPTHISLFPHNSNTNFRKKIKIV